MRKKWIPTSKEYLEYRRKWDTYPKEYFLENIPIHLDIEVTTRCNLRCIMCEQSFNPPEPMDMSFDVYKKVIDEFASKGGSSIKLCYLGEPLLHKDLGKMIKYAKKKGIIDVRLATNGNLLTNKKATQIVESGLDLIIFSIDSCKPEIYEQIRVNGHLEKVIQGLEFLNQLKEFFQLDKPKIQIQAIPMELNREEINSREYHNFFRKYAHSIRISPFCEDYTIIEPIGKTPDFFCESVYRRMTIWADGSIAVCCGARTPDKILGHISQNTLEEIWLGEKFMEIRNLMKERKSHLIEICKTCTMRSRYV